MSDPAKRIARLALLTALGALLLLLAGAVPSGRLAVLAVASFPVCAALMMYGPGWSAAVYVLTALLGLLLMPGVTSVGYAAFFGWYPIVKSLCERVGRKGLCPVLKLAAYTAAAVLYWVFARELFSGGAFLPWYGLYLMGAAAFFVFDWAYSLLIRIYLEKLARFLP